MIRLRLSAIMGERRLKISDVARETGINRGTITRIYHEDVEKLDLDTLEELCRFFEVDISDMLEMTDETEKE